jgi:predicted permease
LILTVVAVLLVRSVAALRGVDPGFDTQGVVTLEMALTGERFATLENAMQVVRDGLQHVRALPNVEAAAAAFTGAPLSGTLSFLNITVPGSWLGGPYYAGGHLGGWQVVSPAYFETFRIPLVTGRSFTDADGRGSQAVAIVNETLARQFWPGESALGRHIRIGEGAGPDYEESASREIVGVVGDVRHVGPQFPPRPTAYVPFTQLTVGQMAFLNKIGGRVSWFARAAAESVALSGSIERELRQASGGVPVVGVRSMTELSQEATARREFDTWLMTVSSASALLLAALGVFGVTAHTVRQRTRELAIRVALGADAHRVRRMVVVQGMRLALCGIAIGIVSALAVVQMLKGFLFEVSPHDPAALVSTTLLLVAVAFASVWVPARRATAIEPAIALRDNG